MVMKHIKIFLILLGAAFITISCDLDVDPESAVTRDTFFSNDDEVFAGVINIYDAIQGENFLERDNADPNKPGVQVEYLMGEMLSDNTQTRSGSTIGFQFETYTLDAQNAGVLSYYRGLYNIIFNANLVLENLTNADEENIARYEGEARFVRAYAYFNLVRFYGDVPLIDEVIEEAEIISKKEKLFTRIDQNIIYDLIIADLQFAIEALDNTYRTRASKAAAQGYLAKVYLTLGTNYTVAQQLLEDIINSGDYSLEPNFLDIFYKESNNETIFAVGYEGGTPLDSQAFSAEWLNAVGRSTGVNYLTDDMVAAFNEFGGDRGQFSFRDASGDPGLFQVVKYLPEEDEDIGIPSTTNDPRLAGNDWIVLRYADILLLHVEAIMAGGNETSAAQAITSFQAVRDRAGLTDPVMTITKEDLLNERRVELAFENHRFLDLKRFGVAQEVLTAFSQANNLQFSVMDLLLPIPSAEIGISNGILEQNDGY